MLISRRRFIHAISYEVILLVIIAIALSFIFSMPFRGDWYSRCNHGHHFSDLEYDF